MLTFSKSNKMYGNPVPAAMVAGFLQQLSYLAPSSLKGLPLRWNMSPKNLRAQTGQARLGQHGQPILKAHGTMASENYTRTAEKCECFLLPRWW